MRSTWSRLSLQQCSSRSLVAGAVYTFIDRYLSAAASLVNLVLTVGGGNTVRRNRAGWQHDEGVLCSVVGSLIGLVGCAGRGGLPFKNAVVVDHLEGNYQRLARCTYQHLARQQAQLSMSDLREQETVRIALTKAPQTYWELSFVNEDGGRQTRLELTSGSYPSEHTLALARACAA